MALTPAGRGPQLCFHGLVEQRIHFNLNQCSLLLLFEEHVFHPAKFRLDHEDIGGGRLSAREPGLCGPKSLFENIHAFTRERN